MGRLDFDLLAKVPKTQRGHPDITMDGKHEWAQST